MSILINETIHSSDAEPAALPDAYADTAAAVGTTEPSNDNPGRDVTAADPVVPEAQTGEACDTAAGDATCVPIASVEVVVDPGSALTAEDQAYLAPRVNIGLAAYLAQQMEDQRVAA
ncbi:hypothetical protein [Novosphingobium sp.]|uniref:hypothetical protein n=1 Tax=Novosphingobium sp. TaxID=1874826 RepID=UPI00260832BF|nr:hypothetical protein [Novosphingobium sp.]